MHIYKVLGSYSPLHPPTNSCQILHQMALSPSCSLLIFHITLHLVNAISVYMRPSMHTGLPPNLDTLSPKKMTIHSGHSDYQQLLSQGQKFSTFWNVDWFCLVQVTTVVHLCVHHSGHVQKTALHNTLHHPPVLTSVLMLFHKAMSLGVGFDIDAP